MAYDRKLKVKFNAPLQEGDTELTTRGCRANNPDICANCYLDGICAFVRPDGICMKPTAAWKKQFTKLAEDRNGL